MGAVITATCVLVINIILWALAFKKLYSALSTQKIVDNVKKQLDQVIKDVNRNAQQNITLTDNKIVQLKDLLEQTQLKMQQLQKQIDMISLLEQQQQQQQQQKTLKPARQKASRTSTPRNATKSTTKSPNVQKQERSGQPDSLDAVTEPQELDFLTEETTQPFLQPLQPLQTYSPYIPNITIAKKQITPKKDFATKVKELEAKGFTIDEIAKKLSVSVNEVQLVIEML